MSFHVLSWVADHSPTKGAARLLLVMMADMANDEGWMEAKTATLASRCNVDSERAIQKQINALEKAGAIQVIPQAADSGRSLNNAFIVLTPGRAVKEIRSRPPRVSKRSPSPRSEPEPPRVSKCSPSHPVQMDTLTPSESSPSPRPNVHPHKRTVLQEPTERNLTEQQQQPRVRARANGRGGRDPGPPATAEDLAALRHRIATLSLILGEDTDWVTLLVTGKGSGRPQNATLNLDGMSSSHARRSIMDANAAIRIESQARGIDAGKLRELETRAEAEAPA